MIDFYLEIWFNHHYLCSSSLDNLSRKAEGFGPLKPWQPILLLNNMKVPTPVS